ncbi:hypothetical protein EDB19DRAFT_1718036 [Suillus lakei]|nr:hypothetical protein EDB19DRAFT_1718036 [Suillus lakei]
MELIDSRYLDLTKRFNVYSALKTVSHIGPAQCRRGVSVSSKPTRESPEVCIIKGVYVVRFVSGLIFGGRRISSNPTYSADMVVEGGLDHTMKFKIPKSEKRGDNIYGLTVLLKSPCVTSLSWTVLCVRNWAPSTGNAIVRSSTGSVGNWELACRIALAEGCMRSYGNKIYKTKDLLQAAEHANGKIKWGTLPPWRRWTAGCLVCGRFRTSTLRS